MHDDEDRPTFTVAGIGVRVQPSGLLLSGLVALSVFQAFAQVEGRSTAVLLGALSGLSFLLSILAHELGHAFEARHRDLHVTGVRLFLLGGVTSMRGRARGPWDEFAVAAVGPFVSLVLAAVFGTGVTVVGNLGLTGLARVADVLGMLAWLNLALAAFNTIPGAPLDGGRMLRAVLWRVLGDRERAVRAAARAGQLVALALGGFGLWTLQGGLGGAFSGLWAVVLAVFMWQAAASEHRTSVAGDRLRGRALAGLPAPPPTPTLDEQWSAEQALAMLDPEAPDHAVHVVARDVGDGWDGIGLVELGRLRRLAPSERSVRRVGDLAVPLDRVPAVEDHRSVKDLVDVLQEHPFAHSTDVAGRRHVWTLHRVVDALEQRVPA